MRLTEKIAIATITTVLFKVLLAGLTFKLGTMTFSIGTIDSLTIAALLTPTLGAPHLESWVGGAKGVTKNDT